jgi:hypothetical protein
VRIDLDLGQAACSQTVDSPAANPARLRFRLSACPRCGVIQLRDTPNLEALRPPVAATVFRDPERHLDDLAAALAASCPKRDGLVLGLTYKDAPLLDRMRAAGFSRTKLLDRIEDWGLIDPRHGIETIQGALTPSWAEGIRHRHGPASILCVRHVLEHAHDVAAFLNGCRTLLAPDGCVLFETPGCEGEFSRGDAGALWEEHVLYFTAGSLRRGLARHGFACRWVGNYPYDVEDCLAAFGQFVESPRPWNGTTDCGQNLLSEFDAARRRLRARLEQLANEAAARGRTLAFWGAGHRTATFVQLLPAADLVSCFIDDDPAKQGRCVPGTAIPVVSAGGLFDHRVGDCIGLLNGDVWQRIVAKTQDFIRDGGRFWSWAEIAS